MKYAFVVSACKKYVPELCALLNSLEQIGNKNDVFVIGYELPESFVSQFSKLSYTVIFYDIPEAEAREFGGESEILCRKRYWYAAEWGKNYDAVCILDADMVICRSVDQYFEIAAKTGFLCGASLEQKRIYGEIEHHKVDGVQLLSEPTWNAKDVCCAPMFVDVRTDSPWNALLKHCWTIFSDGFPNTNFKAPDMESYNLLILATKRSDRVLLLPNYSFVGTNEKLLKPYTRVTVQTDGNIWTESGEPIYIIHGQFYKLRWRRQQVMNRHGCARGYLGLAYNSDRMAEGAMNCLYEKFMRALNDGPVQIEKKAYTFGGDPGDSCLGGKVNLEGGDTRADDEWAAFQEERAL